jgi:hypothetical protein
MQFPESTQGYNRYAYAGNNPLTYTDPSGFSFWKKLLSVVGVLLNFIPGFQGWSTAFWRGFITGFLTSGGNLKAALLGGVGGALFGVVGGKTMSFVQRALLHGLIGGSISALGGGRFGSGFLGAFAGGLLSPQIEGLLGAAGTGGTMGTVLRTIASAIVGGISSKLGGGKFLNGAAMAAFARLFNDERHASTPAEASDPTEDTADNQEFDSSVPRYHDNQVSTPICDAAQQFGCTAEYVFSEGLSRYPAPGLDGSYVRNQEIRELPAFGKTQFLVDRNNFKIRNVTLPGHLLHPVYFNDYQKMQLPLFQFLLILLLLEI